MIGMLGGPGFGEMAAALADREASPLLLVGLGLVSVGPRPPCCVVAAAELLIANIAVM
ncbi:hypothetical protein [Jiella pelagia]|uniref:Uncharacterized protein n=1 Tax=Jiella pelagia TaxID=2986949 RepID=A0ABY7BYY3_9HYPH|nr:hypothetical protein [Jiella pelagia]WAP67870.1 hypothetical protein OH818_20820 [Jiella pelagia]